MGYTCFNARDEWIAKQHATKRAKRLSSHLQPCRRTLQPMSDVHVSGRPETGRRVPASCRLPSAGFGSVHAGCTLVCIPVFSDSDATRLGAAASSARPTRPVGTFKIMHILYMTTVGVFGRFNLKAKHVLLPVIVSLTWLSSPRPSPPNFAASGISKGLSVTQNVNFRCHNPFPNKLQHYCTESQTNLL